jgi:hypothetical protein
VSSEPRHAEQTGYRVEQHCREPAALWRWPGIP